MTDHDNKISAGMTPISRGMKYQKLSTPKDVPEEDRKRLKKYDVSLDGRKLTIEYDGKGGVVIDGKMYRTEVFDDGEGYTLAKVYITNKQVHKYRIERYDGQIFLEGHKILFDFQPSIPKLERKQFDSNSGEDIKAPLPGTIFSIPVNVGDEIKAGQVVAILEAMKMQNELLAKSDGIVSDIKVRQGAQVTTDQLIMIIGPNPKEN